MSGTTRTDQTDAICLRCGQAVGRLAAALTVVGVACALSAAVAIAAPSTERVSLGMSGGQANNLERAGRRISRLSVCGLQFGRVEPRRRGHERAARPVCARPISWDDDPGGRVHHRRSGPARLARYVVDRDLG